MNPFLRRSIGAVVLVSFALLFSSCQSWQSRSRGARYPDPATTQQADTTGARAAMLGQQAKPKAGPSAGGVLAIGAVIAGALGWVSQNQVEIPNTDETGDLRAQRNLTRGAWICLAATGALALAVEATKSMSVKKAEATEQGGANER